MIKLPHSILTLRLTLLGLLMACFSVVADQTIFSLEYKTRIEGIPITTDRSVVQLDDGSYEYRMRSSNFLAKQKITPINLFHRSIQ